MARKKSGFGKFLTAAAFGAAAAGVWYYLKGRNSSPAEEDTGPDDDFDEYDKFDDLDEGEKDAANTTQEKDAEEDAAEEDADEEPPSKEDELHSASRSYVSLDLQKAKDKADEIISNVSGKVEDTVNKIRSSEEFGAVTSRVDGAVTKIRNSEEFGTVAGKINEAVERIRNSNEYANVDEQMEHAINRVKEATERAVNRVGAKINATVNNAAAMAEDEMPQPEPEEAEETPADAPLADQAPSEETAQDDVREDTP